MSQTCAQGGGGKGNKNMFIERQTNILPAGVQTPEASMRVSDHFQCYMLQDEVDALINDSLPPKEKSQHISPLKRQPYLDKRNASFFTEVRQLINPKPQTKFQALVEDFKNTAYKSYWKKSLGQVPDPVAMLPQGLDVQNTCFGKKTPFHGRLCDVIFPPDPVHEKINPSKEIGVQVNRHYCESYNPNLTFGKRTIKDTRGRYAKCCVTDDSVTTGNCRFKPMNSILADFKDSHAAKIGLPHTPNKIESVVPPDHTFGILKPTDNIRECFTTYKPNVGRYFFLNCLKHLNTVRRALSKRLEPTFFRHFYLELKYYDAQGIGWLDKETIYDFCSIKYIRFNPTLIEPLLEMWNAFDGSRIEYNIFIRVINYREPLPTMPKILDMPVDYPKPSTTYVDMVKLGQKADERPMAGVPSARYFDLDYPIKPEGCCKADIVNLPEETDAKTCLSPSVLTLYGISHRDMYANRTQEEIKKVFRSAGERFSDQEFETIWEEAKKYNSQGWVSFETFKRALNKIGKEPA